MFIAIDPESRIPIYQQITDEIRTLIARGTLREGTPLPTVRQLAADLGVNLNTIATAYRVLQGEGLISIRHGAGAAVTSRRATESNHEDLRKSLRSTLAQLILAGLPRTEIISLVAAELRELKAK